MQATAQQRRVVPGIDLMHASGIARAQDPSYPVYVDTSVIMGNTGEYNDGAEGFDNMTYMVCNPENGFFPDLSKAARTGAFRPCLFLWFV